MTNINEILNQHAQFLPLKIKSLLSKKAMRVKDLALELEVKQTVVKAELNKLQLSGVAITARPDGYFILDNQIEPGGHVKHISEDRGDGWSVAGFVSDNHLGSKHERLDVLNKLYDIFEEEGVKHVYQTGNMIEGESRLNRHDIKIFGMEAQGRYFVDNWPYKKKITTHFVTGNDHEGWYAHREQVNIGLFLQRIANESKRTDLSYIGNIEADIELCSSLRGPSCIMKILHGGGGVPYALSYVLQKTVEAFQGGEKPAICVVGHHHKFDYCYPRNVHAFMPGCTQDQSVFMRTRKIEAHVGGVFAKWKQEKTYGTITEFELRWIPFYDRGFYKKRFE